jgi:hypothetical protein
MQSLRTVAQYVRSKTAGPFWVTIDVFCGDEVAYKRIVNAPDLQADAIGSLYGVPAKSINLYPDPALRVLKISFPRPVVAGSFGDPDAHSGQYFVPLLSSRIP